jgi:hypothetical protein
MAFALVVVVDAGAGIAAAERTAGTLRQIAPALGTVTVLDPQPCHRLDAHARAARWCLAELARPGMASGADAVVLVLEGGVMPSPSFSVAALQHAAAYLNEEGSESSEGSTSTVVLAYSPLSGLAPTDLLRGGYAVASLMAQPFVDDARSLVRASGFDPRACAVTRAGLRTLAAGETYGEASGEARSFAGWFARRFPDTACSVPAPLVTPVEPGSGAPATSEWQRLEHRAALALYLVHADYLVSLMRQHRDALALVALLFLLAAAAYVVVRRARIARELAWWVQRVRSRIVLDRTR